MLLSLLILLVLTFSTPITSYTTKSYTFSWGSNSHSALGHAPSLKLLSASPKLTATRLECGERHCLVMGENERLIRAIGQNSHGQLGDGSRIASPHTLQRISFEALIDQDDRISDVHANLHWSAAITAKGKLFFWGEAYSGNGDEQEEILSPSQLVTQPNDDLHDKRIIEIALGEEHAIIIDENGSVYGMGYNVMGQTGVNDANVLHQLKPVLISGNFPQKEARAHAVAAGAATSFVILRTGNVLCFGNAQDGLCADGNVDFHQLHAPRQIEFPKFQDERVVQIAVGNFHAVARTNEGQLYAWGRGAYGQLGNQKLEKAVASPVTVILPPHWEKQDAKIIDIKADEESTLILLSDGRMGAFGDNSFGGLMHDILQPTATVIEPSLVAPINVHVFGMGQRYSLIVTNEGALYEVSGTEDFSAEPQLIYYKEGSHLRNVLVNGLAGGVLSTVLVTDKGEVVTLGDNSRNELAAGDEGADILQEPPFNNQRIVPRRAALKAAHTFVSDQVCLSHHGLVVHKDNEKELFVWGDGDDYQLGTDEFSSSDTIVQMPAANIIYEKPNSEKVVQVACGVGLSGFVSNEGNAYTFGRGSPQGLGDGTTTKRFQARPIPHPVTPEGTRKFLRMSIGKEHFLLLTSDHQMYAFGLNDHHELGHPAVNETTVPVKVEYDDSVAAPHRMIVFFSAATNGHHNLAIVDSREAILCWGRNTNGQCGVGSTTNVERATKVDLSGVLQGKKFLSVAAGEAHSLILDSHGHVFAMGSNEFGQLGVKSDKQQFLVPTRISSQNMPSDAPVRLIAAGAKHSLAVLDYYACNEVAAFDAQVCSGHGKCLLNPTLDTTSCSCTDSKKWAGDNCEIPVCNGLARTESKSCSGNGYCFQPDECRCDKDYYGQWCENRVSFCGTRCIISIVGLVVVALFALTVASALILLVVFAYKSSILTQVMSSEKTMSKRTEDRYHKMIGDEPSGVELTVSDGAAPFGSVNGNLEGDDENDQL